MYSMRRTGNANLVIDIAVAAVLVVALGIVFGLDRSSDTKPLVPGTDNLVVVEHRPDGCRGKFAKQRRGEDQRYERDDERSHRGL